MLVWGINNNNNNININNININNNDNNNYNILSITDQIFMEGFGDKTTTKTTTTTTTNISQLYITDPISNKF